MHDRGARLRSADGGIAISCDVTGKCGDIDGVWIEPVTAQVMMTLRAFAMFPPRGIFAAAGLSALPHSFVKRQTSRSRRSNRSTSPALWYSPNPTRNRDPRTSTTMFFCFSRVCQVAASG